MQYKVGDKVRYIGKKNNLWGDTHIAEEHGYLIPGEIYEVDRGNHISEYVSGNIESVKLLYREINGISSWGLSIECVEPVQKSLRRTLPAWL